MVTFDAKKLEKNSNIIDIEDISNEILKNTYLRIKDEHKLNNNELILELPYYFEKLALIPNSEEFDIKQIRLIIWGKIIENLNNNNFSTRIKIDTKNEKCILYVKWTSSFDKYKKELQKYKDIIINNMV
jgi:hypothetical protein